MEVAAGTVGSTAAQGSPASPRAVRIGIAFLRADRILGVDTQMQGKAPLEAPSPSAPGSLGWDANHSWLCASLLGQ